MDKVNAVIAPFATAHKCSMSVGSTTHNIPCSTWVRTQVQRERVDRDELRPHSPGVQ